MADLSTIQANIVKVRGYVTNLFAVKHRTAAQDAKLAIYLDRLARFQRDEAAWHVTHPSVPEFHPVDLGPDPIPNNSVFDGNTYGADMTSLEFQAKYGRSPEQVYSEIATSLLRPRLPYTAADVIRQAAMIDYFAGRIGFAVVAGYFGGWYGDLGVVDVSQIHDLGAGYAD